MADKKKLRSERKPGATVPSVPPCANQFLDTGSSIPISKDFVSNRLQVIESYTQLPRLLDGGSLDFLVESSQTENICLLESFLHLELSVVKLEDGKEVNVKEADLVSYSPLISSSLFKNISLTLNDETVSYSNEPYHAMESVMSVIMHMSQADQRRFLSGAGLLLSPPDKHKQISPLPDPILKRPLNPALADRHTLAVQGKHRFTTPILWPLFLVPRLLPTGVELKLSMALNTPQFCLIATVKPPQEGQQPAQLPQYQIKISKAQLYLQKYRLTPSALAHQERILASPKGALYPSNVLNTSSFTLGTGVKDHTKTIVHGSKLPRMIYVYMVKRDSLSSMGADPFCFDHNKISSIHLEVDGQKYPNGLAYTPDFPTGNYVKDFALFQRELAYGNPDLGFRLNDWEGGYTIFPFNLVADRSFNCNEYLSVSENPTGTVSLHMHFSEELPHPVTVFVTQEHFKTLALDSKRKPHWFEA